MTKYYKLTNQEDNHHGFQYQDGLNEDHLPFNETGSCCPGGLYFSDAENILQFLHENMYWIREVSPDTEKMVQDPNNDPIKWRSKSLDCQPRKSLSDIDTWIWMIDQGILNNKKSIDDALKSIDYALQWSSQNGHFDVVKFLVDKFDKQFSQDSINSSLRWSSDKGHLNVVKFLVDKFDKQFSQDDIDYALRWSSDKGHLDIVKFLVEKFDNFSQDDIDYALRWSSENGHLEVVKFLVEKFDKFSQNSIDIDYALKCSSKNGHLEIHNYLKEKLTNRK